MSHSGVFHIAALGFPPAESRSESNTALKVLCACQQPAKCWLSTAEVSPSEHGRCAQPALLM